jgi:dTDP-4-dehydrorhamnose 3,5-epimerase
MAEVIGMRSRSSVVDGVRIVALPDNVDGRGDLFELFREEWPDLPAAAQWNVVRSHAGVLRGVHWHEVRDDLIGTVSGRLTLGLVDLRVGSPTQGAAELLELDPACPELVIVPTGVGHGLLSVEPTVVLYGLSEAYDAADEFGVAALDPALGLDWPLAQPLLSERDSRSPGLAQIERLPVWAPS